MFIEIVEDGLIITRNHHTIIDLMDQRCPGVERRYGVTQARGDILKIVVQIIADRLLQIGLIDRFIRIDVYDVIGDKIVLLVFGQIAIEHEGQNVVLVLCRVHVAAKLVGHCPQF